jgi:hypothetical protein
MIACAFTLVCGKVLTSSTDQLIVNEIELEFGAPGLFTTKVARPHRRHHATPVTRSRHPAAEPVCGFHNSLRSNS